jgi:hypothetical protein
MYVRIDEEGKKITGGQWKIHLRPAASIGPPDENIWLTLLFFFNKGSPYTQNCFFFLFFAGMRSLDELKELDICSDYRCGNDCSFQYALSKL